MSADLIQQCFFLLGPTAVGKTELAVSLAEHIGGEIVGADAFQVYQGLDLLSAKPSPAQQARVPHHLVGEIPLSQAFDVAQYRALAVPRMAAILERGRIPIICGGTGMYVRALTHGLAELPPADSTLRAELEKESLPTLVARLRELDPAACVDEKNPRRVIRALEVCLLSGRPFSASRAEWKNEPPVHGVILDRPREQLLERIAARTQGLFAAGVVEEVAATGDVGPTAAQMLGLREIRALLAGSLTRAQCVEAITIATRQYAKRQLTWFRRERAYAWVDLARTANPLEDLVRLAEPMVARSGGDSPP